MDLLQPYILPVKILRVRWNDFVPTTKILELAHLPSIESMLMKRRLKWLGHVRRMPDHRLPKQLMCCQLEIGDRKQYKPQTRWKDIIKRDLKKCNFDIKDWWNQTSPDSKNKWRSDVHNAVDNWENIRMENVKRKRALRKKREKEAEEKRRYENKTDRKYQCQLCPKGYTQSHLLYRHVQRCHPEHNFFNLECKFCKRKFTTRSGLGRHKCLAKE